MEHIIKNQGSERYTVFPIKHPNLWKFYKDHEATFWTVEEIRLTDDLVHWKESLNDNERFFIKNVLAFFAASDGIVNQNLAQNFVITYQCMQLSLQQLKTPRLRYPRRKLLQFFYLDQTMFFS